MHPNHILLTGNSTSRPGEGLGHGPRSQPENRQKLWFGRRQLRFTLPYRGTLCNPEEWYDIKAPSVFSVRSCGKTLISRTQGTKIASEEMKGRDPTASTEKRQLFLHFFSIFSKIFGIFRGRRGAALAADLITA